MRSQGVRRARAATTLVALFTLSAGACSQVEQSDPTSLVPLVDPADLPTSSIATSTTAAVSSDPNSPLITALPDGTSESPTDAPIDAPTDAPPDVTGTAAATTTVTGPGTECGYADLLAGGEITFVVGDRLYGSSIDGALVRCLWLLQDDQRGPVTWAPQANRVLLNSATLLDGFGPRSTGFEAINTHVEWEYPEGGGLIGPTSTGRTLVRRSAGDTRERTEVTFLALTVTAVAHPGGRNLIGSGQARDGMNGIYLAGIDGSNPQPLALVASPDQSVVELAPGAVGDVLWFITDSGDRFTVQQLLYSDLTLTELTAEQAPISQLVAGPSGAALAWKVGLCNSTTITRVRDERTGAALTVGAGTPLDGLSVSPVGWLDSSRLVVAARPLGCDGPADVWIWNLLDGAATLLVKSVDFPAVRVPADPAFPLTITPGAQPGVL